MSDTLNLDPILKLTKDLKKAAVTLSKREVRYLVDSYYMIQEWRITANNQVRDLRKAEEPHSVVLWLLNNTETLEEQIKKALDAYSLSTHMGQWARGICGIGPVIAAGLESHIDITKAPTVGHIWRFAGLDPTVKWEKGQKRPWNASLKCLCWKISHQFVIQGEKEDNFYGKIYRERKALEQGKNETGDYAEQAEIGAKRVGKSTEAHKHYSEGVLPPGHIHSRAKRYSVKLFLSHYHEEAYRDFYKTEPPKPYPISILGHAHYIEAPKQDAA